MSKDSPYSHLITGRALDFDEEPRNPWKDSVAVSGFFTPTSAYGQDVGLRQARKCAYCGRTNLLLENCKSCGAPPI